MAEPLGLSSLLVAPMCQHRLEFVNRKDFGGGSQGLISRLVIVVGRPNMPTWVGRWQDEGVRQWWTLSTCRLRWRTQCINMGVAGRRRELGGGGDGEASQLVIVVDHPNIPTGVGSWQDEGDRRWRDMTELL